MIYRIDLKAGLTGTFVEPCSKCVIHYFSNKEMLKQYRDKNFNVIGEIGGFSRVPVQGDILLTENGSNLPIHPRGSRIRPFEWVIGYAALENDCYLAVIRSLLCSLIHRKGI